MTENEKEKYNQYRWFLDEVEPYGDFKVADYYGVMFMKVMRNSTYDIRLQYNYEKHPQNGSSFKVDTIEEVIEWIELMESFSIDKSSTRKAKKYNSKEAKDYTKKKLLTEEEVVEELKKEKW